MKNFKDIWHGGYFEGNPIKPMEPSSYGIFGYSSTLNLIYQACIKPYVDSSTTVLEVGPGRGAFTKCFTTRNAKKIYAVDAAPPDHTHFWDHVGQRENITYLVAEDTCLRDVPDDSIDYFFTFGCLCHTPASTVEGYISSLAKKMKSGGHGFLMIADYDKYNYCHSHPEIFSIQQALRTRRTALAGVLIRIGYALFPYSLLIKNESQDHMLGRFFHYGIDRACQFLMNSGFIIIERDMEVNHRDPVIHFRKL